MLKTRYRTYLTENRELIISQLLRHIGQEDLRKAMMVILIKGEMLYARGLVMDQNDSTIIKKLTEYAINALREGADVSMPEYDADAPDLMEELYFKSQSEYLQEHIDENK